MNKKILTAIALLAMVFAVSAYAQNNGNGKVKEPVKLETEAWVTGAGFHCGPLNVNAKVDVSKGVPFTSKTIVKVERVGDTNNWKLLGVCDVLGGDVVNEGPFMCPVCKDESPVWISFSNQSGVPNGKNIQFNCPGAKDTPPVGFTVTIVSLDGKTVLFSYTPNVIEQADGFYQRMHYTDLPAGLLESMYLPGYVKDPNFAPYWKVLDSSEWDGWFGDVKGHDFMSPILGNLVVTLPLIPTRGIPGIDDEDDGDDDDDDDEGLVFVPYLYYGTRVWDEGIDQDNAALKVLHSLHAAALGALGATVRVGEDLTEEGMQAELHENGLVLFDVYWGQDEAIWAFWDEWGQRYRAVYILCLGGDFSDDEGLEVLGWELDIDWM